jgi:hypothetical protein
MKLLYFDPCTLSIPHVLLGIFGELFVDKDVHELATAVNKYTYSHAILDWIEEDIKNRYFGCVTFYYSFLFEEANYLIITDNDEKITIDLDKQKDIFCEFSTEEIIELFNALTEDFCESYVDEAVIDFVEAKLKNLNVYSAISKTLEQEDATTEPT